MSSVRYLFVARSCKTSEDSHNAIHACTRFFVPNAAEPQKMSLEKFREVMENRKVRLDHFHDGFFNFENVVFKQSY